MFTFFICYSFNPYLRVIFLIKPFFTLWCQLDDCTAMRLALSDWSIPMQHCTQWRLQQQPWGKDTQ